MTLRLHFRKELAWGVSDWGKQPHIYSGVLSIMTKGRGSNVTKTLLN